MAGSPQGVHMSLLPSQVGSNRPPASALALPLGKCLVSQLQATRMAESLHHRLVVGEPARFNPHLLYRAGYRLGAFGLSPA